MPVITVPKVLREKLGEDGADSIVELINLATQQVKEDVIALSAEKFEKRLTEEITKLRGEVKEDLAQLRSVDLAKLDKKITDEIARLKGEDLVRLEKKITDEISKLKAEDLAKLDKKITDEIAKLKAEDLAKLEKRITEEVAKLRVEFTEKISQTKVDIIRWMFIFWIGQFASIVGTLTAILFAFFK